MQRDCHTCAKYNKNRERCDVLTVLIGLEKPCWAWTDDPHWEQSVKAAVEEYKLSRIAGGLDDALGGC